MMTTKDKDPQTNQGESFDSDPIANAASGLQVDYDFSASDSSSDSDDDAAPTKPKHSFMCGGRWVWLSLAAVLFTTFVVILGGAFGGIAANYQATQAAFKGSSSKSSKSGGSSSGSGSSSSSKSGKSGGGDSNPADAEEPEEDAVRVQYEGEITSDLDCGSDTETEDYKACVQSTQTALAAVLQEQICVFEGSLVPPCRVAVKPPRPSTDEADRRRLDHRYTWEYIASLTALGPADSSTIAFIADAIAAMAAEVKALEQTSFDVSYGAVVAQFNILVAEMDQDPADYNLVTPNVPGYQLVGAGCCLDSFGGEHDYLYTYVYDGNQIQECMGACDKLTTPGRCIADNGWTLVGFALGSGECVCFLDDVPFNLTGRNYYGGVSYGDVCRNDTDTYVFDNKDFTMNGEGPVMFTDGSTTCSVCFRRI